jgi:hypothetical protein
MATLPISNPRNARFDPLFVLGNLPGDVMNEMNRRPDTRQAAGAASPPSQDPIWAQPSTSQPQSQPPSGGSPLISSLTAPLESLAEIPTSIAAAAQQQAAAPSAVPATGGLNPLAVLSGLSAATVNDSLSRPAQQAPAAAPAQPSGVGTPQLQQIVANRQAAEAARAARLAAEGMSPEAIDARMFPQHGVTPDPMRAQARANDFAERQGRVNAGAMAERLMRRAHINGQEMPMAQAYAIAMNMTPTTNAMNQGAVPSLPGMDPSRMAMFSPAGGAVAGQFQNGQDANANTATRDQLQANTAQMGIQQQGANQQQNLAQQMLQMFLGHSLGQQQQNTNDAVARNAMGATPQMQQQQAERTALSQMISSPNHAMMMATSPEYRQLLQQRMAAAYGQSGQPPAPAPAPAPQPPAGPTGQPGQAAPSLSAAFNGVPDGVSTNPAAMQQWLSMTPESDRPRLEAMAHLRSGNVTHPSVYNYVTGQYAKEDPNLYTLFPDALMSSFSSSNDPGLIQGALGTIFPNAMAPRAEKAARHVEQTMGIPYEQALQIMTRYFNS